MLASLFMTAGLAAAPSVALNASPEIHLTGREIRLGDVALVRGVGPEEQARLAARVIARLPDGGSSITLPRTALASLIRRAIPALSASADDALVTIRRTTPKPSVPSAPVAQPETVDVKRGDELTLVSTVGPVRIQRRVIAAQPGRSGRRIFVRDEDGQILSIPLSLADARESGR